MTLGARLAIIGGGEKPDLFDNYVKHDLMFHLDGIYNLGSKGRSDMSNTWTDCVTKDSQIVNSVVPRLSNGFGPFRTPDHGGEYSCIYNVSTKDAFAARTMTIEGVVSAIQYYADYTNGVAIGVATYASISAIMTNANKYIVQPKPTFGPNLELDYGTLHTFSVRIGDGTSWMDGVKVYTNTNIQGTGGDKIIVGSYCPIRIHDCRVYSANLTDDEIRSNASIDLLRYSI